MKKLFAILTALVLALTGALPANANEESPLLTEQRQFQKYGDWRGFEQGHVTYNYTVAAAGSFSNTVPFVGNSVQKKFCPTLGADCYSPGDELWVEGYLPLCKELSTKFCISGFRAKAATGAWAEAEFLGYVDLTPRLDAFAAFKENMLKNVPTMRVFDENTTVSWQSSGALPASATGAAKFRVPGVLNAAGTDTYLVKSTYQARLSGAKNGLPRTITFDNFETSVVPYFEAPLARADTSARLYVSNTGDATQAFPGQTGATGDATIYAWSEYGRVGYAAGFTQDSRFRVAMQVPTHAGGWYHGRMNNPMLSLANLGGGNSLLTIEAGSVKVPITTGSTRLFEPDGSLNRFYKGNVADPMVTWFKSLEESGQTGGVGPVWVASATGINDFTDHEELLGDSAKGAADVWFVALMRGAGIGQSKCMSDTNSIQGLITTNSMVYQAGVPKFTGGFLQYNVGGLHFDHNNQLQLGEYDLIMKSAAARCLYGFSNAPISATVSVVTDKGAKTTATTMVSEKNGWLKLSAKGFTFSKKTIKVKITKKATEKKK